jgi:plasmid stabilization system protein ParE
VTGRHVLISSDAEAQLDAIRVWWRSHRTTAPDLLDREFDAVVLILQAAAFAFPIYRIEDDIEIRRILLPRSGYAVYFTIDRDDVLVVAVWHTARGTEPPLP